MTEFDRSLDRSDVSFLRRAISIASTARTAGEQPIGALLVTAGEIVREDHNRIATSGNPLAHPELGLATWAVDQLPPEVRRNTTLYSSQESCAMCAGASYWAGLAAVVYAFSGDQLMEIRGRDFPTIALRSKPLASTFIGTGPEMRGPCEALKDEAAALHVNYWQPA